METLEELKEIIENAPEGSSHIAKSVGQSRYLKHNVRRDFVYYDGRTFCAFPSKSGFLKTCKSIRSLSDIKHRIELMENNQQLQDKINQFDKAITDIGKHIQKSEPNFSMSGVDVGDSQGRIVEYIEKLEAF